MEKIKTKKRSVGIKRILAIFYVISIIAWVLFLLNPNNDNVFTKVGTYRWLVIFPVGSVVAYFVPQLIYKMVYWVLDGFKMDKETQ